MKPIFAAATLALGLCSCAESAPVVQILQTIRPDDSCNFTTTDIGLANGSLNLAVGGSYLMGLVVRSGLETTPIDVNGVPLDPEGDIGGNATAYVQSLRLSYNAANGASLPDQEVPYTLTLNPSSNNNRLVINLMTADTVAALNRAVSATDPTLLRVTFKLAGKFAASNKKFESNEVVFGINVSNRAIALKDCAADEQPTSEGPCGTAGQDGFVPSCKVPTTGG
jgi:hypothetical protein